MSNFFDGKWKPVTIKPEDEQNVLVSWEDSDGNWQGPFRAYYCADEQRFFLTDGTIAFPALVEIWIEIPEFPK